MNLYYITHETAKEIVCFTVLAPTEADARFKSMQKLGDRPLKTKVKQSHGDCFMTARKRKRREVK